MILQRVKPVIISIITIAMMLMTVPSVAQAAGCLCYLNNNDCLETYVDTSHNDAHCKAQCQKILGKNFQAHKFESSWVAGVALSIECADAHDAVVAAAQPAGPPSAAAHQVKTDSPFVTPKLNIPIPGVKFTAPELLGGSLQIDFLGSYIEGVYKYLLTISVTIAIVMVMIGGIQYTFGGASQTAITKAKTRIKNGVIGLVLLLSVYIILFTVNPQLIDSTLLELQLVEEEDVPHGDHDDPDDDGSTVRCKGSQQELVFGGSSGGLMFGRCNIVKDSDFPKFNLNSFTDRSSGRCLLKEYFPDIGTGGLKSMGEQIERFTFLGKTKRIHKKAAESLKKVEQKILSSGSSNVRNWVKRFSTGGIYVPRDTKLCRALKNCQKAGLETWLVVPAANVRNSILYGKVRHRLATRIVKNLNGNHDDKIRGDYHTMGLAIDVHPAQNRDFGKSGRPMGTNIPSQVVDAFHSEGWQWLGSTAGRDPMHFQYKGSSCTGGPGRKYPRGNGCCKNPWTDAFRAPRYDQCILQGGKATTYTQCLGPGKGAGNMWIKQHRSAVK